MKNRRFYDEQQPSYRLIFPVQSPPPACSGDPAANRRRTRGAAAGSPLSRILSRRGAAGTGGASHRQPPSPAPIGEPAGPLRHPSCRNSQLVWYHRPASADLPERQRSVRQKGSAVLYQWRRRIRYYPPGSGADVPCFHLPARLTGVRQRRLGGATVPLAPSNRRSLNRLGDTACASPLTDWSECAIMTKNYAGELVSRLRGSHPTSTLKPDAGNAAVGSKEHLLICGGVPFR